MILGFIKVSFLIIAINAILRVILVVDSQVAIAFHVLELEIFTKINVLLTVQEAFFHNLTPAINAIQVV